MPRLRLSSQPTIITRADRARAAGEWQLAAGLYRVALDRTPHNPPIWIQYGHALKECGNPAEAEAAYRIAIAYKPADADAHLQLGHALKLQGKRGEAEAAYRQAWMLDRSSAEAARELTAFGWTRRRLAASSSNCARRLRSTRRMVTSAIALARRTRTVTRPGWNWHIRTTSIMLLEVV